jgi:hypothetical protein
MKNCVICNTEFEPKPHNSKNCSEKCRAVRKRQYNKKYWAENKEAEKVRTQKWREENSENVIAYNKKKHYEDYHSRTPEQIKADYERLKVYFQSPLGRERKRAYHQRPEVKSHRKVYDSHPESKKRKRAHDRKWSKTEKGKQAAERRKQKTTYTISNRIRANMNYHLKKDQIAKRHLTFDLLGYTPKELKAHLESQFTEENGYTWDNMSEWHIDHIRPISSFNFDSTEHSDFKKCWALNNLQPLWAMDNMSKGNNWDGVVNA